MSEIGAELYREVGRLEGQVGALQRTVGDMQCKVDEMHRLLMRAQGGWRVLVAVGGASAAMGALVTKLLGVVWR